MQNYKVLDEEEMTLMVAMTEGGDTGLQGIG